jgi:hypothetical protein
MKEELQYNLRNRLKPRRLVQICLYKYIQEFLRSNGGRGHLLC